MQPNPKKVKYNDVSKIAPPTSTREQLVGHHLGPHLSQSALAYSLQFVRDHGVASSSSRPTQLRARQRTLKELGTPYGPIVVPLDLPVVINDADRIEVVSMIHPLSLLWRTLYDCLPFAELVSQALVTYPCTQQSPWRLCMYFDEVTPSTDLQGGVDGRNMQCIYWTFAEFGVRMYHEDVWLVLGTVRSNLVNNLMPGGMSRLVATGMRMFFNPDTHDASIGGIQLQLLQGGGGHLKRRSWLIRCRAQHPHPRMHKARNHGDPCFRNHVHMRACWFYVPL